MKLLRSVLYFIILTPIAFLRLNSIEIANLKPIEALWVSVDNNNIVISTDTGDIGCAISVDEALIKLKDNSESVVYFDTARFLFVDESATKYLPEISPYVKTTIRLCQWDGQGDIRGAIRYADSRKIGIKLNRWNDVGKMPEIPSLSKQK